MNNELSFTFTCRKCENKFNHKMDLELLFNKSIYSYEKKILEFETIDNSDNVWKFQLCSYTMKNYLYYRYYLDRLKMIDANNPDLLNQSTFIKPVLYINKLWRNNEEVENWEETSLSEKIKFINVLPSEVMIDRII